MYEIYTIQNEDTIEIIAQKLGIDPAILYQINGLTPNYVPNPGTNIIIPETIIFLITPSKKEITCIQ